MFDHHAGDPGEPVPVRPREKQHRAALQPGQVGQEIDGEHRHQHGRCQRRERAPGEADRAAAELTGQAGEQRIGLGGEMEPVGDLAEAGRTVLEVRHIVREVAHHGLELIHQGRDHRLQECGGQAERHQDDHQDRDPPLDTPAHQHADGGVQADRQEQGDQRLGQHAASGVNSGPRGGRGQDPEAYVKTPSEQHHRAHPGARISRRRLLRSRVTHRCHRDPPTSNHTALIKPVSTASSATAMTCPFTRAGSYATPRSPDDDPPPGWLVRAQSHWRRAESRKADVASWRMFRHTAQFATPEATGNT